MGRALGIVIFIGLGTAAHADSLTATASRPESAPVIGVMADVGLPDAGTASIVVRPIRALRLELGCAHDLVGPGVRGGVTWIPLASWATPVLGVAYGHFFDRDANPLARTISGDASFSSPVLDKVGYDFAVARAGLELGRKHFTFFLHAGVTRVTAQVHGVDQASNAAAATSGAMVTVSSTDPNVRIWSVSANLGFIIYLH